MVAVNSTRGGEELTRLQAEKYTALVDSLFQERRTFLIGAVIMSGAIVMTYWKTGESLLALTATAFSALAIARLLLMSAYQRVRPKITSVATARKWEHGYLAGAAASVLIMGCWSFIAFAVTSDPYVRLVSFAMTIAFLLGVFGRNVGSGKFVVVQILCAWIPLSCALLITGDVYYIAFAILLTPFFISLNFISERFRNTLPDAIAATTGQLQSPSVSIPHSPTCHTACACAMRRAASSLRTNGSSNCSTWAKLSTCAVAAANA